MASSAQHPLPLLKSFTAFFVEQDGSQTWKQLIPTMIDWLHSRRIERFTEQTLSSSLQKLRRRVITLRRKKEEAKQVVADYEALQGRMANTRMPAGRRAAYERNNASIIKAYNERKEIQESKWDAEEERVVQQMDELVVKRRQRKEEKENKKVEDKQARKRKAKDEKEEKAAKKRKEKEDKQAADEQKLRDVEAKRTKLRDERASQIFAVKQAKLEKRRLGAEDVELDRKLKRETLSVLKSIGNVFRAKEREMGISEQEEEKEQGNKENTNPSEE